MPGSEYWESVTLERTHCCVLTGLEGTSRMTSRRLEEYFNSPNEKVRRPEKARNGGIRGKKRERGWRWEGQTLRSSEHRRQGNVSGPGFFFATITEVVLKWLEMRTHKV